MINFMILKFLDDLPVIYKTYECALVSIGSEFEGVDNDNNQIAQSHPGIYVKLSKNEDLNRFVPNSKLQTIKTLLLCIIGLANNNTI